jgi:hypothetical protein
VRDIWFDWLRENRPDLLPRYEELYERGAYMPRAEADRLAAMVRRGRSGGPGRGLRPPRGDAAQDEDVSRPPGRQPRLF